MKEDGWDGYEPEANKTQWTFTGSLFYSIIVITTIGKFLPRLVSTEIKLISSVIDFLNLKVVDDERITFFNQALAYYQDRRFILLTSRPYLFAHSW